MSEIKIHLKSNPQERNEMTKLNLTSADGMFVSYDLATIKNIKNGKAKKFYSKEDCEGNGIKLSDSVIKITFKDGNTASFGDNWSITFA